MLDVSSSWLYELHHTAHGMSSRIRERVLAIVGSFVKSLRLLREGARSRRVGERQLLQARSAAVVSVSLQSAQRHIPY